jgi:putative transposase
MRASSGTPDLRAQTPFRALRGTLVRLTKRASLRVVHFSVQRDHVHMIVETPDGADLARGLQGLASGIARVVNRAVGRRGRFWRDRHHRRELKTPREVRTAIVYVLMNFRKHAPEDMLFTLGELDPRSSAAWFEGWDPRAGPLLESVRRVVGDLSSQPTAPAGTWLGRVGWQRLGLIRAYDRPATS